jgi:hypothetical protein
MEYQALLKLDELIRFLKQFNGLESAKKTKISISSLAECDDFTVVLITTGVGEVLLRASFEDGLLHDWGWREKFTRL